MGWGDLLDGIIGYYRITLKSKKFYLRFFYHFIDMIIVTGWLLFRRDYESNGIQKQTVMDSQMFRSGISETLCKFGRTLSKRKTYICCEGRERSIVTKWREVQLQKYPFQMLEEMALDAGQLWRVGSAANVLRVPWNYL